MGGNNDRSAEAYFVDADEVDRQPFTPGMLRPIELLAGQAQPAPVALIGDPGKVVGTKFSVSSGPESSARSRATALPSKAEKDARREIPSRSRSESESANPRPGCFTNRMAGVPTRAIRSAIN